MLTCPCLINLWGRPDLNRRPLAPQASIMTKLDYGPQVADKGEIIKSWDLLKLKNLVPDYNQFISLHIVMNSTQDHYKL